MLMQPWPGLMNPALYTNSCPTPQHAPICHHSPSELHMPFVMLQLSTISRRPPPPPPPPISIRQLKPRQARSVDVPNRRKRRLIEPFFPSLKASSRFYLSSNEVILSHGPHFSFCKREVKRLIIAIVCVCMCVCLSLLISDPIFPALCKKVFTPPPAPPRPLPPSPCLGQRGNWFAEALRRRPSVSHASVLASLCVVCDEAA